MGEHTLFRTSPDQFLISMRKNGMIANDDITDFQVEIDKLQNNDMYINQIVELFEPINSYSINSLYYVIIYMDLSLQKIKNLYRCFLTKWNLLKIKHKDKLKDIKIENTMDNIVNYDKRDELKLMIVKFFNQFISNGDFYFLFFMNTFHEYLYPITK